MARLLNSFGFATLIFALLIASPLVSLGQQADVPEQLQKLFKQLDDLGRDKVDEPPVLHE